MPKELLKAYEPAKYEDEIYKRWEESGFFNPDNLDLPENAPSYTIVLPPPNITDKLHLGHSSMLAIEDLLIRFHRMKGYRALWVPGTDHAAIATQNVVEKKIFKEEGKTRHDLGREKFLEKVWEFLKVTQSRILLQTRKMGASLDWSRVAFTLDEQRAKAVKKMFVDMYEAGVIYRGERIVNWCPRCQSTLADDEVEHKEQKAIFYTFKYDKDFPIAIDTTRPETKLGDVAVAVNPKDERYKKFVGQIFAADFCGIPLKIKVIADRGVDMTFGTGALGVTPAHSMVDWQMAEKNNLPIIKVIDEDDKIKEGFGRFSGKLASVAREMIVEELKKRSLIEKEEEIANNLSVCYRCGSSVEPLPSKQWFVSVDKKLKALGNKSLKEKSIEVAEKKQIKFIPERFTKRYLDWMTDLHDWCISRQIWFGHRIPVWYRSTIINSQLTVDNQEEIYVGIEAPEGEDWKQDEDTLDTWFSSGMWTFSTLGWPYTFKDGKKSGDLARFHPTQVLETGYEIITLWVSRMIMMSLFAVGEIPFENVYLHGMVWDKNGKKMSKSKGNGIDPIDVINKYGTDAVRLSLLIGSTPGNDVRVSEERVEGFRNMVNKLWNVSRYILQKTDDKKQTIESRALSLSDRWILGEMKELVKNYYDDLENYRFSQTGESLRDFTWNSLADWYLEASKFEESEIKTQILNLILTDLLKLWHPLIPFVTEAIWQEINPGKLLMVERLPQADSYVKILGKTKGKESQDFGVVISLVSAIRNARAENKVEPSKKIKAIIYAGKKLDLLKSQEAIIKGLKTGIEELEIKSGGEKINGAIYAVAGGMDIYLIGAIDAEKEKARIEKESANMQKLIKNLENKLSNQEFIGKAPASIVEKEKEKLENYQKELEKLKIQLQGLA
jgi:valyl-tRNA synthetase